MQQILKNIITIIGLGKLLNAVWEMVYEELEKLTKESTATWDDKAVKILDEMIKSVILSLDVKKQ
ncbi:MAG: hypothetical protein WAR79_15240 [Melioribacteraceae bacterium]